MPVKTEEIFAIREIADQDEDVNGWWYVLDDDHVTGGPYRTKQVAIAAGIKRLEEDIKLLNDKIRVAKQLQR